jgi:23S rRNA maturation mini-RNase III
VAEKKRREEVLKEAWIGDAVLCLYARQKILREDGRLDGEKYTRMTSNRFLASIGEPSEVEAEIGRIFERDGLKAAYLHIEQKLMPVFERQEQNYLKRGTDRSAGVMRRRPEADRRRAHAIV